MLNLEDVEPADIGNDEPLFGDGLGLDSIDALELIVLLEKDSSPIYKNLTKKERNQLFREKFKLADLHRGIKDMRHLPSRFSSIKPR